MATSTEPARRRRSPPSPARSEPRQRDADRSQQAILAAARDEFHEHGLGGARATGEVEFVLQVAAPNTTALTMGTAITANNNTNALPMAA